MSRREFDCCECDRHVFRVPGLSEGELPLCALCLAIPGWFRDPELRALLDPDHDGREKIEKPEAAR